MSVAFWGSNPKIAVRCDLIEDSTEAGAQCSNYRASIVTEHDHTCAKNKHMDKIRMLESESTKNYSVVVFETGPLGSIEEAMQTLLIVTMGMVSDKSTSGHQPGQPARY